MTLKLTLLATVLCLPSWFASAQQVEHNDHQWVNQSQGEVPSAAALQVKVEGGSIRLAGHSGDQISYLVDALLLPKPESHDAGEAAIQNRHLCSRNYLMAGSQTPE